MATSGYEQMAADRQADYRQEAYAQSLSGREYELHGPASGAAWGFTVLAGVLLVLDGAWAFVTGLAAVLQGSFFLVTRSNYAYNISISGWGWIHIALGVVLFATGCCLFLRQTWARVVAIIVASASAILNLMFIPRYPLWSILMIAVDLLIIWAVARVGGREAY
jgi:hypothetical protein